MRRNRGLKFEIEQLFKFSGETSAKDVHQAADSVGMK